MEKFFDILEDIIFIISQISEFILIILVLNGCYHSWFIQVLCFDIFYYFCYIEYC